MCTDVWRGGLQQHNLSKSWYSNPAKLAQIYVEYIYVRLVCFKSSLVVTDIIVNITIVYTHNEDDDPEMKQTLTSISQLTSLHKGCQNVQNCVKMIISKQHITSLLS